MKSYGKLEEYRASLFEAVSPFQVSISTTAWVGIRWGESVDDLEIYDDAVYNYDPQNPEEIIVKKSGWYQIDATINLEQTSGSSYSNTYAGIYQKLPSESSFTRIAKTLSFAFMKNTSSRYGSIKITAKIPIVEDNTVLVLNILRQNVYSSIFVREGEASLGIQRLRPLVQREVSRYRPSV